MIAAIIVEETAIPIFPNKKAIRNNNKLLIIKDSKRIAKRNVIAKFIRNTSMRLKSNLPEKIVDGEAIKWRVRVVPRSSSETKALERPDIAEKKITTHNNPPVRYSLIFSLPIENIITLMVTRINIERAFNA
jgi:hypothetical protein